MRTKEEILEAYTTEHVNVAVLEVLLDIRELLVETKKELHHD